MDKGMLVVERIYDTLGEQELDDVIREIFKPWLRNEGTICPLTEDAQCATVLGEESGDESCDLLPG